MRHEVKTKRRRYNSEYSAIFLQQVELGILIKDICRKHGFTEQTFYRWKMAGSFSHSSTW